MLLTDEGKLEFLKTRFHQYFDITISTNIVTESVEQFVNFVLPMSKINEYYDMDDFGVFLNDKKNNVIFTPADDYTQIYRYEYYQGVYFIRTKPFSKTIRMHIIPKKYDASDTASNNPLLFFKDINQKIDENVFTSTQEYERRNTICHVNLYYKQYQEIVSNGMYKFNIKQYTKDLKNLQINIGYSYNETNPTNKIWHVTGVIDESDEDGVPVSPGEYTEFNSCLVDTNADNKLDHTNKILQHRVTSEQIDWANLYVHDGGFDNPHTEIISYAPNVFEEYTELSDSMYTLFRGDLWTINSNYESSAAITSTSEEDFTVTGTFRTDSDLIGIYWNAKDLISHPYISYGEQNDFSNVILEFDYEMSGCRDWSDSYNDTNNPCVITINQKNGSIDYLLMNQFIDGNHVRIDFNDLHIWNGDSVIVTDIESIMLMLKPEITDANYTGEYTIIENVDFYCKVTNISVTNGDIKNEFEDLAPHQYRLCEGYDDFYNLNPRRITREMRKLGYVEWCDLYIGASHFYEKNGTPGDKVTDLTFNHNRTEKMVLDQNIPLNKAFAAWLDCYARELKANDTDKLIISVSMENLQCPHSWRQRDVNGNFAITGWVPSTFFYSPCNTEVLPYMQSVSEACLDIVVANNMQPILQLGEAWWWWNENDRPVDPISNEIIEERLQPPCFYDNATKTEYIVEFGEQMPEYSTSWGDFDENTIDWLNQQIVDYSDGLREVVKSSKYENGLYMALFFPPSVTDVDRVPPMMQRVNYLSGIYSPDKLDVLQLEDYDWVTGESPHHKEVYSIGQDLGFPENRLHYFGGFVQYPEDAVKFWSLIEDSMEEAIDKDFKEVFVWAGSQVRRDNAMIGYDHHGLKPPFENADIYHKTLKYFNDALYIEENELYLIKDWIELRSQ